VRCGAGSVEILGFVRATQVAGHFASRLSLIAFATAIVQGLIDRADFQGTLQTALLLLAVFFGLGYVIGEIARRVVEEGVQAEFDRMASATADANATRPSQQT
jgi:hypothetical protein